MKAIYKTVMERAVASTKNEALWWLDHDNQHMNDVCMADARDIQDVADALEDGRLEDALALYRYLDTLVRDNIYTAACKDEEVDAIEQVFKITALYK